MCLLIVLHHLTGFLINHTSVTEFCLENTTDSIRMHDGRMHHNYYYYLCKTFQLIPEQSEWVIFSVENTLPIEQLKKGQQLGQFAFEPDGLLLQAKVAWSHLTNQWM